MTTERVGVNFAYPAHAPKIRWGVDLPIHALDGVRFSRPVPDMLIKFYKKYNFS